MAPIPYLQRRAIVPLTQGARSESVVTTSSFLANAPKAPAAKALSEKATPNPKNVQGDVFWMFPKKFERFMFFIAGDKKKFFTNLKAYLPSVTSGEQTIENITKIHKKNENGSDTKLDLVSSQIAFSRKGLNFLGITDSVGDAYFDKGSMRKTKDSLGDSMQWDSVFDAGSIHGVILVTAGAQDTCQTEMNRVRNLFKDSIEDKNVVILEGRVRSGDGEHFGWRDGISQPGLKGLCEPQKGQRVVDPGVLIMGYPGDSVYDDSSKPRRPSFTKDGSLMVFRKLEQAVLLFEDYIDRSYKKMPDPTGQLADLTDSERKTLFGARIVGRFKKGAPLALTPLHDNVDYTKSGVINNFDYSTYFDPVKGVQEPYCPFGAHIRKTAPRNLDPIVAKDFLDRSVILRSGIPYGPDVTKEDRKKWKQKTDAEKQEEFNNSPRGLLFVCYQSSIENGFYRQTTQFANNSFFPTTSLIPTNYGPDPIISGPKSKVQVQKTSGGNFSDGAEVTVQLDGSDGKYEVMGVAKRIDTNLDEFTPEYFVTSRGGEWFFVPSIPVLKEWAEK